MYHMININKFQAFLAECTHMFPEYKFCLPTPFRHIGGMEVQLHSFLTWALYLGECSKFMPQPLHSL